MTVSQAQAYQIACGETSSVLETEFGALQLHRGGSYTFWDENGVRTASRGYWRSARNGDVRVTTPEALMSLRVC